MLGDLGKAADLAEQQRLAEGERGEEHAGLVDLAVGQHDEVGAPEERRELGVGDEARDEAHARRRAGAQRAESASAASPTTHSSAPPIPRQASSSTSMPL